MFLFVYFYCSIKTRTEILESPGNWDTRFNIDRVYVFENLSSVGMRKRFIKVWLWINISYMPHVRPFINGHYCNLFLFCDFHKGKWFKMSWGFISLDRFFFAFKDFVRICLMNGMGERRHVVSIKSVSPSLYRSMG